METHSAWYSGINKQVNKIKDLKGEKNLRKYKLNYLLCIAERVDSYSGFCSECQSFQKEITEIVADLSEFVQIPDDSARMPKEKHRVYFKTVNKITSHLQKQHNLVIEGQNLGLWISIGTAIGVAIGASSDSIGFGIPIGIAMGTAVGTYLDNKAKKEGRVICPREVSGFSKNTTIAIIILGLLILAGAILFLFLYRG